MIAKKSLLQDESVATTDASTSTHCGVIWAIDRQNLRYVSQEPEISDTDSRAAVDIALVKGNDGVVDGSIDRGVEVHVRFAGRQERLPVYAGGNRGVYTSSA